MAQGDASARTAVFFDANVRKELAQSYVEHLGETTYSRDDIELSPTRALMAYVQEPCDLGYSFLTDEELLSPLQVTLYRGGGDPAALVRELLRVSRELLWTSLCVAGAPPTRAEWDAFWLARGQTLAAVVRAEKATKPTDAFQPYYTADPAFLDWLEDEKRGWPVLKAFLEHFEPDWFTEYMNTLAEDAQATEDMHADAERVRLAGVAGACNAGRRQ